MTRDKMRMAIVSSCYPFGVSESFLANEVEYLSRHFEIDVYPVKRKNSGDRCRVIPENVRYHEPFIGDGGWERAINKGLFSHYAWHYLKDLPALFGESRNIRASLRDWAVRFFSDTKVLSSDRFRSVMESDRYDIVYFYWGSFPIGIISCKAKRFVRIHGGEIDSVRNHGHIPLYAKRFVEQDDIVYMPISRLVKSMLDSSGVRNQRLSRIGVYDKGMGPNPEHGSDISVMSCSNVIALKRVHLICKALMLIANRPVRWVHFGDGPLFASLKDAAAKLPGNIKAELRGRVPNHEVITYFQTTPVDLFINVSLHEGVPVSVMEAFSFGVPCAATDVGATAEIVDTSVGLLLSEDVDIVFLAQYIREIRKTSAESNLRHNARLRWSKLCNAENNFQELAALFKTEHRIS